MAVREREEAPVVLGVGPMGGGTGGESRGSGTLVPEMDPHHTSILFRLLLLVKLQPSPA